MIFAGFPPTMTFGGTSLVTTDPDAMIALSPIVMPGFITALPPIQTLLPTWMGFAYSFPEFLSVGSIG